MADWSDAIVSELRKRGSELFSLDKPENQDNVSIANDIAAGFTPGLGTAMSVRDYERARREGDYVGMGLSAVGMIPFAGGVTKGINAMRKGGKVAKTEFELAHDVAQKNAALPVEQGGLGLPPNNTAMDRAKAMGFNESGYTGTAADIKKFDPSKAGSLGSGSREGPLGTWLTDDPRVAGVFADWSARGQGGDVVYPLKIRGNPSELKNYTELKDILDANTEFKRAPYRMVQDKVNYDAAKKQLDSMGDYVAMRNINTDSLDKPITQYLVTDAAKLRSPFAAFDPAKRDSADLLAGTALGAISIPAIVQALRSQQQDEIQ